MKSLERNIELLSMLTGVEVQSYIANEHCCVVYHMQHKSENLIKHGLRIDMESGNHFLFLLKLINTYELFFLCYYEFIC